MLVRIPDGAIINTANIAYTEELPEVPVTLTYEEAVDLGELKERTRIVYNTADGEYGPLTLILDGEDRLEFLKAWRPTVEHGPEPDQPHAEGDYSYLCGADFCRCGQ